MANISITFYSHNVPVETISLIGAKQSKSCIRKTYGKDSDEVNNDYYFIKKRNKYGIKWVVRCYNRYGETIIDFCSASKTPSFHYKIHIA